jgi:hypothetical protein
VSALTDGLQHRVKTAQDKFTLSKLRDEITGLMGSAEFQQLPQGDRNRVEDLLVEVLSKQDQYKGCDPWSTILGT